LPHAKYFRHGTVFSEAEEMAATDLWRAMPWRGDQWP